MIFLKLRGALGNQLFQYSFARSLSLKYSEPLFLDTSSITKTPGQSGYTLNQYKIKAFRIPSLLTKVILSPKSFLPYININSLLDSSFYSLKYIELASSEKLFKIMDGYWQSYKYFNDYWPEIKRDIILKKPKVDINILKNIRNSASVSIHIRRGDYLKSSSHYSLSLKYYLDAIGSIRKQIDNPMFYVFSDDIKWAEQNLTGSEFVFIKPNVSNPTGDLYLMSQCKHNIIANSTFSWWGAWLNENKDKEVVAPAKWFPDQSRNASIDDLLPKNWLKV